VLLGAVISVTVRIGARGRVLEARIRGGARPPAAADAAGRRPARPQAGRGVRYRCAMRCPPATRRLLGVALTLLLLTGCARLGGEGASFSHTTALPVTTERTVGQTFTVFGSGVVGVDLLLATFAQPADPEGTLVVTLRDELGGPVVATAEVPGTAITDNAWVAARFDGVQPVAGRPAIEVAWDGASPVGVRANVPPEPIDPDLLVNDPYPLGELVLDGELAAGDLAFRAVGADDAAAAPRTLRGLASGAVRGLAQRPLFAAGWALALLGSAALAVWGFRRRPDAA
jgi:hypothetical protein